MARHQPRTADDRQLDFDALFLHADRANHARRTADATAHLPASMAEALPFFRELLGEHDAAMLRGNPEEVTFCREEACRLARLLDGDAPGYLAGPDAPGSVLVRETEAAEGTVPLWGQAGSFVVTVAGAGVRVVFAGMFGIGMTTGFWPGFDAHAVDRDRPFISETGYRGFLGLHAPPVPGMTPERFATEVIDAYVRKERKGRLIAIEERYRKAG